MPRYRRRRLACSGINSRRLFGAALALCIDSPGGSGSIPKDWKLKLPPAWLHIWSRCDGPLAWASINERQYEGEEKSLMVIGGGCGGIDPHLDREPSEKGKKESDPSRCLMLKTSPGSLHRQTTLPFRRGRPFRVKPAQSFRNPLSQQTFEFSLGSAKKGGGGGGLKC